MLSKPPGRVSSVLVGNACLSTRLSQSPIQGQHLFSYPRCPGIPLPSGQALWHRTASLRQTHAYRSTFNGSCNTQYLIRSSEGLLMSAVILRSTHYQLAVDNAYEQTRSDSWAEPSLLQIILKAATYQGSRRIDPPRRRSYVSRWKDPVDAAGACG